MLLENIQNGKAYSKFIELVQNQGGDIGYVKDITKFEKAKIIQEVISTTEGYVQEINAEEIGKLSCELGAGRKTKKDKIDLQVGIILNKKISVGECRKQYFEKEIGRKTYKVFPVYYPVGNGTFNIDKAIEDLKYIIENYVKDTVKTK